MRRRQHRWNVVCQFLGNRRDVKEKELTAEKTAMRDPSVHDGS